MRCAKLTYGSTSPDAEPVHHAAREENGAALPGLCVAGEEVLGSLFRVSTDRHPNRV